MTRHADITVRYGENEEAAAQFQRFYYFTNKSDIVLLQRRFRDEPQLLNVNRRIALWKSFRAFNMKFSQIATGLIQIVGIFSGTTAAQAASDPSVLAILSNLAQYIGKTVEGIALLQNATFNGNASDFFNISKSTTTFRAALADDTPDNSTNIAEVSHFSEMLTSLSNTLIENCEH